MEKEDFTRKIGKWMIVIAWIIFLIILTLIFADWEAQRENPNRDPITIVGERGEKSLVLHANRDHHYIVSGEINNFPVVFLLDTGATDVVIPAHIAKKLNLPLEGSGHATTANGNIEVYYTTLHSVSLGKIVLRDIPASINPATDRHEILLGMSALKHLEFRHAGNTLTLIQSGR